MSSWQCWYDNLLPEDFYPQRKNTEEEEFKLFLDCYYRSNDNEMEKEDALTSSSLL